MSNIKENIFWGMLTGAVGGLAAAFVLWGSWLLPGLGLILTRVDLINGLASMLILGVLGGVIYALIIGSRELTLSTSLLSGVALGVALWVGGVLIAIPLLLGLDPAITSPLDHWTPLVALILHGLIVALIYNRWRLSHSRRAMGTALIILALAAGLTPLMLRTAFTTDPSDLSLPDGFEAEVVAKGFTYPTTVILDEDGNRYVAESGYAYGPKTTEGRVIVIDKQGQLKERYGNFRGPVNGLAIKNDHLYVSHRGKITEVNLDNGERQDLITGLPSEGDHHNNELLFAEDGALYFGQGTVTNAGVVGSDNFLYGWADRYPDVHDIPSRDFTLTGENYEALDLGTVDPADVEPTGAFAPFGQQREEGEKIEAEVPANGTILRYDLETEELSMYADGLRNPYGLAIGPENSLYASNLGYDDRGARAVSNSPDWIVEVEEGAWYGWPDYAGTVPLSDEQFASERGINRKPLISNPPEVAEPALDLPPHYSPMKLEFAPEEFPLEGLLVAIFGDADPLTEDIEETIPSGVLLVDLEEEDYDWFAKNTDNPRAGRFEEGFKRVIDVTFCAEGKELYILDFGVMEFTDLSPNAIPESGVLWKISAEEVAEETPAPDADTPTPPVEEEEPAEVPEEAPGVVPEEDPAEETEDAPEEEPEDVPEETPEDEPEEAPEEVPAEEPEEVPDEEPEETPAEEPEDVPEDTPEEVPEGEPEDIPEDVPEDIPEEDPEDIPEDAINEIPDVEEREDFLENENTDQNNER
ncbi:PQQ-dependent sugar dehydrogenase [Fuchsiella alkaliacetigena]|uniref:PQQ-dependent sugar dehydrogenase n=1 Tax=Fuchsiella alkaliacetigena TaxID=957042 RepID=UPI00200B9386|nr:PQQ-dependent sugar dehydrogenase [Fuchsiella alkaliacetigena]MCK8824867.1 PQQ-dependent sugar dehydrogenase [Fuchsiella alkaliacetigena]